jgi:hypothetical protein
VKIPAIIGEDALVPSLPPLRAGAPSPASAAAQTTIPSSVLPDVKAAAAEISAVARLAQPVPVSTDDCQVGIANSVLQPLVVTSWPAPFARLIPKLPSSHTASSYVVPDLL